MMFWSEKADAVFFAPLFQIALCIFIPVALMGTGLLALIAAATRSSAALRLVSGRLVFWNTIGSSLGGFLAGYVFLHLLGLHGTLTLLGFGSLALAAVFFAGCLATPLLLPRVIFLFFVAILVFNAYRRLGYGTGSPWKSGDDARWEFYDDGKTAKKKWKPPSGKEVGAFFKEYAGLLVFLAISAFFIVFGIMSGSCRNGFNRKEREPARIERD